MRFIKMHGTGNDYVYVNGFEERVDDPAGLAGVIADRHRGVGGDGLILVLPPSEGTRADARMQMFNADGSEAEMCGNGVRCVCKLVHDHGISSANPMQIETGNGVLSLTHTLDAGGKVQEVRVDMGEPVLEPGRVPVALEADGPVVDYDTMGVIKWLELVPLDVIEQAGLSFAMTCVSMGNPHAVFYCKNVDLLPLEQFGSAVEHNPIFPNRINVHFVQVRSPGELVMRTWERGSGITQACGTGAAAVCVAGVLTGRSGREVLAHLPGGDLRLCWQESDNHVHMTGPAVEVFRGEWPE